MLPAFPFALLSADAAATAEVSALAQVQAEWRPAGRAMVVSRPLLDQEEFALPSRELGTRLRRASARLRADPSAWFEVDAELEATPNGAGLHGQMSFIEPWTGERLRLRLGDLPVPFGREPSLDAAGRTFVERATTALMLFPRERYWGAAIDAGWRSGPVRPFVVTAVMTTPVVADDAASYESTIASGRAGVQVRWLRAAGSGWWSHRVFPTASAAVWRLGLDGEADWQTPAGTFGAALEHLEGRAGSPAPLSVATARTRGTLVEVQYRSSWRVSGAARVERFQPDVTIASSATLTSAAVAMALRFGLLLVGEWDHAVVGAGASESPVMPPIPADVLTIRIQVSGAQVW